MVDGPVSKRKISRRMKRNALYLAGAVILLAVLGVLAVNFVVMEESPEVTTSADATALTEMTRPYADAFADYFGSISDQLAEYANTDNIRNLFESGTDEELAAEAGRASSNFRSVLLVRLLRPGEYVVDNTSNPPLSYGSLAVLNKVERTSGPVAAEVLLFGTDDQHIVLVERVKDQADQLIGVVHLSLDVSLFLEAIQSLDLQGGYMEIQQASGGTPLVLASRGDSSLKTTSPGSVSIAGSRWRVSYWPPSTSLSVSVSSANAGLSANYIIYGILLLLAVSGAFLLIFRKRAGINISDQEEGINYQGAIKAIMEGAHPGMEKLIKHFPGTVAGDEHEPVTSDAMDGDDITSIANPASLKPAVDSSDVFDITQSDGETGQEHTPGEETIDPGEKKQSAAPAEKISPVIFRKYDIRGKVDTELTVDVVKKIGMALGSQAEEMNAKTIVVGRDGRNSSPELAKSLIEGLTTTGRDVIDIGVVPTPVLYFATHHLKTGNGVMVTGSHNGPQYNGLKIVLGGNTLSEEKIVGIHDRIKSGEFASGNGNVQQEEVISEYVRRISEDIPVAFGSTYKLVVDCGNGAASIVASQLYRAMGHDVIELYCELDGNFPNHHPDPSQPENLQDLITKVREEQADLGFAFDGDGDRLGVVDAGGNILWPDRQMMIFARDVLSRNQGAEIIFDVKCSKHLKTIIESSGGKPLMWKTGHSLIKRKMKEVKAPLAGEMSGHIFFSERWYGFDDALYSGARLLEILTNAKASPKEFFAELPSAESTPELRIDLPESEHSKFMADLETKIAFDEAEIITIDGFRVEFSDGWGLIRPSNTTPCLIARFEADNTESLKKIQDKFRDLINSINPDLSVPF